MKVYIVTAGEYSDYHIEKVFTDREQAAMYMLNGDEYDYRQVEEFDTDNTAMDVNLSNAHILIVYNYNNNWVLHIQLVFQPEAPDLDRWYKFRFTVPLSDKRLYTNIVRYGKDCQYVKKVAQDMLAKYCYEHSTSRDGLILAEEERMKAMRHINRYLNYTTSL